MGKKKKGKKKKEVPPCVKETEHPKYQQKIVELNRELAKLYPEVLNSIEKRGDRVEKLREVLEDRKDVEEYFKRLMPGRASKIEEHTTEIMKLEETLKENIIEHAKEQKTYTTKCSREKQIYISDVKILKGTIMLYDKVKDECQQLLRNYQEFYQKIFQQKGRHFNEIYNKERGFVIQKYKITNDIQKNLKKLVKIFNHTRDMRIAIYTQIFVRENIVLHADLNRNILKTIRELGEIQRQQKKINEFIRYVHTYTVENARLKRSIEQQKMIIENLDTVLNNYRLKFSNLITNDKIAEYYEVQAQTVEEEIKQLEEETAKRKSQIRLYKHNVELLSQEVIELEKQEEKYRHKLFALKDIVSSSVFDTVRYVSPYQHEFSPEFDRYIPQLNLAVHIYKLLRQEKLDIELDDSVFNHYNALIKIARGSQATMSINIPYFPSLADDLCIDSIISMPKVDEFIEHEEESIIEQVEFRTASTVSLAQGVGAEIIEEKLTRQKLNQEQQEKLVNEKEMDKTHSNITANEIEVNDSIVQSKHSSLGNAKLSTSVQTASNDEYYFF